MQGASECRCCPLGAAADPDQSSQGHSDSPCRENRHPLPPAPDESPCGGRFKPWLVDSYRASCGSSRDRVVAHRPNAAPWLPREGGMPGAGGISSFQCALQGRRTSKTLQMGLTDGEGANADGYALTDLPNGHCNQRPSGENNSRASVSRHGGHGGAARCSGDSIQLRVLPGFPASTRCRYWRRIGWPAQHRVLPLGSPASNQSWHGRRFSFLTTGQSRYAAGVTSGFQRAFRPIGRGSEGARSECYSARIFALMHMHVNAPMQNCAHDEAATVYFRQRFVLGLDFSVTGKKNPARWRGSVVQYAR